MSKLKFKNEKEIKDFFKNTMFKFDIVCDGIANYKTLNPFLYDGTYIHFEISFFIEDKPFLCYDNLSNFLSDMQIFEVNSEIGEHYHQKYINYQNN
jgi:hypothetical protein